MDFGFNSEKFLGEIEVTPWAQIINPFGSKIHGFAVPVDQAELSGFKPDDSWQRVTRTFDPNGKEEDRDLYLTHNPRMHILHRSALFMKHKDANAPEPFDKTKRDTASKPKDYKPFTWYVVLFLDKSNKPLSQTPLRIKATGLAGLSFGRQFDAFRPALLKAYATRTGDKQPKNKLFYAHGVFAPNIEVQTVTSKDGETGKACITTGFEQPTPETLEQFLSPNNGDIETQIKATEPWVKLKTTKVMTESEFLESAFLAQYQKLMAEADSLQAVNTARQWAFENANQWDGVPGADGIITALYAEAVAKCTPSTEWDMEGEPVF